MILPNTKSSKINMSSDVPPYPYIPSDLVLPDYVPLVLTQSTILAGYLIPSVLVLVLLLIWILSGRCGKLSKTDRVLMWWWAFTGLTHIILEGYFVFSPEFFKEKTGFYLAEGKNTAKVTDSRYAGRESGVVAIEGITAVLEGPACLLAVYAIGKRASYSYILQVTISLCQLYGTLAYYISAILDGDNFSASTLHYYAYYILANSFWIWVPAIIIIRNWKKICAAPQVQTQTQNHQKKSKTR